MRCELLKAVCLARHNWCRPECERFSLGRLGLVTVVYAFGTYFLDSDRTYKCTIGARARFYSGQNGITIDVLPSYANTPKVRPRRCQQQRYNTHAEHTDHQDFLDHSFLLLFWALAALLTAILLHAEPSPRTAPP